MAIGEPFLVSSALSLLKRIPTSSGDTQAQMKDAIESAPVVVEALLPSPIAKMPESDDVEQQPLAVTPVEAFGVPPCTIIGDLTSSEVELQLTESTSVVVETPCSVITAIETPASSEVDEQPPTITPAEAPDASNTDWYVFSIYEMDVG